ncbi:MAG: transglutaminase family protein [Pseudomonadota bacterium]
MPDDLIREFQRFAEEMQDHPLQRPPAAGAVPTEAADAAVTDWLTAPRWVHAEFEASLLVARALDADLSPMLVRAQRDALLTQLDPGLPPWEALTALGFAGDREDYGAIVNSRIDQVMARLRGIPISLAVLLLEASRHVGLTAMGINQPGHFLVQVEGQLVDPFNLVPLPPGPPAPPATPLAVLLRMLNNVKGHYLKALEFHRALDLVSLQLAVAPQQAEFWCEKGDLWARIGGYGGASRAYREALDCLPSDHPLVPRIQERLAMVGRQNQETLH